MTPKTQQIVAALKAEGWINTEWAHTGGGCYAIRVPLGDPQRDDFTEVMVTGEDVFFEQDWRSDDNLQTEDWYVGSYDQDGDYIGEPVRVKGTDDWPATLTRIVITVNRAIATTGY